MNAVRFHLHRVLNRHLLRAARDRKDILAMQALTPLSPSYLPWNPTAMRPSAVMAILNEIVINGRRRIVELGSGISTFYIGRLLRDKGGHLTTVEHDEDWAQLLEQELRAEGLEKAVTVVQAPLVAGSHGARPWYAEDALRPILDEGGIDLLIVDGPPAYEAGQEQARYPAVPFFRAGLAPDCTVILDDINRRGEQEILQRWESLLGLRFDRRYLHGTIGIARTRQSYTV
jgi:predicted O-methyltransferase YrrM